MLIGIVGSGECFTSMDIIASVLHTLRVFDLDQEPIELVDWGIQLPAGICPTA